jgi:methyl-accepting chemotaxis protein
MASTQQESKMAFKASNIKIGARLSTCFGVIIALSMVSTGAAMWQSQKNMDATRDMLESPLAKERLLSDWLSATSVSLARTTVIARSGDPALAKSFATETAATSKSITALTKKIEPLLDSPKEQQVYKEASAARARYLAVRDRVLEQSKAGRPEAAAQIFNQEFAPFADAYHAKVKEMSALQRAEIDDTSAQLQGKAKDELRLAVGLSILVAAFAFFCARLISRGITRPLLQAVAIAATVAKGDLTSRFPAASRDEVGALMGSLETMNASLKDMVSRVQTGSASISLAASEIASGNLDLSNRTESQAASLEETASSMEELTTAVNSNADNAKEADSLARGAAEVAGRGGQIVERVAATMTEIDNASKRIGDIIGVVDSIAFQTNILALNAAVEAARAGEQGRGFAVVATEVRALAHRSAEAAKEIKALVQASAGKVGAGADLVKAAGETMEEVVREARKVADVVGSITAASQEQSHGIRQINQTIAELESTTQQNAALVEEAAAAAASLDEQAANLSELAASFKLERAGA